MASIDYVQFEKTDTGKRIHHEADAETANKRLYRPITRHLGDQLVRIEADDIATTLLIETTNPEILIQLLHKGQVEAMSEGETKEWQIVHGNFGTDEVTEEYLDEDTEAADVAARLLAIQDGYNNPTPVRPTRSKKTPADSAPKLPRKTTAKAQPEPEVEQVAPKRAKLPRKTAAQAQTAPQTAPKTAKAKLPTKKVAK